MPQAASVNNDDANGLRQTGQEFHWSKINHDGMGGSTLFFIICHLFLRMGVSELMGEAVGAGGK
jgi:hypothetical protein